MKLKRKIDWTRKDADIARELGITRSRAGQMRIAETGVTFRGRRYDPPRSVVLQRFIGATMRKYGVPIHVAEWWHRTLCAPDKNDPPEGFAPVLKINVDATKRKYRVSTYTAQLWIDKYQAAAKP